MEKLFPEAVSMSENGYLELDVHPINMVVYNAIRELDEKNKELQKQSKTLNNRLGKLDSLEQELIKLKALVKQLMDNQK